MKDPIGAEKGRLVIQGSTLSFKGRAHQGESAWKANQCLLMIWVNCFEDGWTSALICRPLESPLGGGFVFRSALPLLRNSDLPFFAQSNTILSRWKSVYTLFCMSNRWHCRWKGSHSTVWSDALLDVRCFPLDGRTSPALYALQLDCIIERIDFWIHTCGVWGCTYWLMRRPPPPSFYQLLRHRKRYALAFHLRALLCH